MKTIKGPAIFLAQFLGNRPPFDSLKNLCQWVSSLGYLGVQLPSWDRRCIDLERAAESKIYCDEIAGLVKSYGLELTELSTHLQGQLVAVNPAYDVLFDSFAPENVRGKPAERTAWAIEQLKRAAKASRNLGLTAHATFSGALLWHTVYPWPPRPAGLVTDGFAELARRWIPILDTFEQAGVDLCYEIHPGEDLHDGITFERFWEATGKHGRCNMLYDPSHFVLQQLDYLKYIDIYHAFIKIFHVKDAEFNPTGKVGIYGGYQDWASRAGRFRSLGDGQVNFNGIFSKFAQYDYTGWAVVEWECCLKHPDEGAKEGAAFVKEHIIRVTDRAFDDFAGRDSDQTLNRTILGL